MKYYKATISTKHMLDNQEFPFERECHFKRNENMLSQFFRKLKAGLKLGSIFQPFCEPAFLAPVGRRMQTGLPKRKLVD